MRHSFPASSFSRCALALLACAAASGAATAQILAYYPLATDLLDATNTHGPMTLAGNPAPSLPNNGVCVNGVYHFNSGGQDVRTPLMPTLDTTDFQVDVEFNITALPAGQGPVLIGGNGWRFLGIYLQGNGTVGIKHNNSNLAWSTTVLSTNTWYAASLRFEQGTAQLRINNAIVFQAVVGVLNDGNNKNFTTNDYSVGRNFHGCIRNLTILNDTSTGSATATTFGAGCAGAGAPPTLLPTTSPQLGTTFAIGMSNVPASSPVAFMTVGFSATNSVFGQLPFALQAIGFGANCNLYISTEATVVFQTPSGSGTFAFVVPPDPAFTGLQLFYQAAAIDPSAAGGFTFTNAVDAQIGT